MRYGAQHSGLLVWLDDTKPNSEYNGARDVLGRCKAGRQWLMR